MGAEGIKGYKEITAKELIETMCQLTLFYSPKAIYCLTFDEMTKFINDKIYKSGIYTSKELLANN